MANAMSASEETPREPRGSPRKQAGPVRILVFLQGTVLMHSTGAGRTREERVAQSRDRDRGVRDFEVYVPIGEAVAKLQRWEEQGAQIEYLTSNRDPARVARDGATLRENGFPDGRLLARGPDESYGDVAGHALPDILIEDDCESIGSEEITYPQIPAGLRPRIKSIIVPEFGGIDHLPDSLDALLTHAS